MNNFPSSSRNKEQDLGSLLQMYRNRSSTLTQEELGKRIGVSSNTVRSWENSYGKPSAINLASFIEVCLREHCFTISRELEEVQTLWYCWQNRTGKLTAFDNMRFAEVIQNLGLPSKIPSDIDLSLIDPGTIFHFNQELKSPEEFFGRQRERSGIINRTKIGGSTSIVGSRRIGKTWLLHYLRLLAPEKLGDNYYIVYLDANAPGRNTVAGFVYHILEGLKLFMVNQTGLELVLLSNVVQDFKAKNKRIIVCIDHFEGLNNQREFNLQFFTQLRSLAHTDGLILVTTSKKPLIDIVGEVGKTSGFFNIFREYTLTEFADWEAEEFVKTKCRSGYLDLQEQQYILKYGQNLPVRLQLAGLLLLEDKLAANQGQPNYYQPNEETYWNDYEARLEKAYKAVVL